MLLTAEMVQKQANPTVVREAVARGRAVRPKSEAEPESWILRYARRP